MDLLERNQTMVEEGAVLSPSQTPQQGATPSGWSQRLREQLERWPEKALLRALSALEEGTLELRFGGIANRFGQPAPDGLEAKIEVKDPRFFRAAVLGGSLGAAEAYMDGWWDSPDLVSVVRLFARNREALSKLEGPLSRIFFFPARLVHKLRANTRRGSQRNIAAHYDLGDELFGEFLDPTLTYSAACFDHPDWTLEQAQQAKLERLARKLQLQPADHVLEIGSGWGSLALYFASRFGCRVTTVTISRHQLETARRRVQEAGLERQVSVEFRDYRDLEGKFSKIVSVEMVEAVGLERLEGFFERVARCLEPEGLFCLQAITIAERFFKAASRNVDFIQRYIFPGGAIPSVTGLFEAATSGGALVPLGMEEFGLDYAETLRRWRERFVAQRDRIARFGFGERFQRMFEYYFSYCEGGFLERSIGDVQILFGGRAFRGASWRPRLGDITL